MELMEMHSSMKPEALKVLLCEKHNKHTKRQDITNYRERMAEIERCKALPMLMRVAIAVVKVVVELTSVCHQLIRAVLVERSIRLGRRRCTWRRARGPAERQLVCMAQGRTSMGRVGRDVDEDEQASRKRDGRMSGLGCVGVGVQRARWV
eukprot:221193-Prymnesium_polylepis.1